MGLLAEGSGPPVTWGKGTGGGLRVFPSPRGDDSGLDDEVQKAVRAREDDLLGLYDGSIVRGDGSIVAGLNFGGAFKTRGKSESWYLGEPSGRVLLVNPAEGMLTEVAASDAARIREWLHPGWMNNFWANQDYLIGSFEFEGGGLLATRPRHAPVETEWTPIAVGRVPQCGRPFSNDSVMVLDSGLLRTVSLEDGVRLDDGVPVPLEVSQCVAVGDGLTAVTGTSGGVGQVAVLEKGRWSILAVPGAAGVLEPELLGPYLVVAAPGQSVTKGDGTVVRHAGVVHLWVHRDNVWRYQKSLAATEPIEGGAFGMEFTLYRDTLWVNYLTTSLAAREEHAPTQSKVLADARVCSASLVESRTPQDVEKAEP